MAIYLKDKEIVLVNLGKKVVSKVYYGTRLVWEGIKSCFGAGWWINTKPWINTDKWKN